MCISRFTFSDFSKQKKTLPITLKTNDQKHQARDEQIVQLGA